LVEQKAGHMACETYCSSSPQRFILLGTRPNDE